MGIIKICSDDKLVTALQSVFKANIVRIPEERIKPLSIIANISRKPQFWGYLNELIEGDFPDTKAIIQTSAMADVSGKQSKSVSLDMGLQILDGFLSGFGLPSAAISMKFAGAKTVSFCFQEVNRYFISPAQLGKVLKGYALDPENTSNSIFLNKKSQLILIDSIITSRDFCIVVETFESKDFLLDIPAIEKMVGSVKAKINVVSNTGLDIKFQGDIPLTFAFTCIVCDLDGAGRIIPKPTKFKTSFNNGVEEHTLLFDEACLIDLE